MSQHGKSIEQKLSKKLRMQNSFQHNTFTIGSMTKETTDKYLIHSNVSKLKIEREIEQGQSIGNQALSKHDSSQIVLAAYSQVHIAVLTRRATDRALQELHAMYKRRMKLLQKTFMNFSEPVLYKLSLYFSEQQFQQREVIYEEGQLSSDLYCLSTGEIKASHAL